MVYIRKKLKYFKTVPFTFLYIAIQNVRVLLSTSSVFSTIKLASAESATETRKASAKYQ